MHPKFKEIRERLEKGENTLASVRELLGWFNAVRRRAGVVERIRTALDEAALQTVPDFASEWLDADVVFMWKTPQASKNGSPNIVAAGATDVASNTTQGAKDATHRIGVLDAANRGVISVTPQDSIAKAVTLMLVHDFSQLAVMTTDYSLKGAISWKSIGSHLSQGNHCTLVKDVMEEAFHIQDTTPLFDATEEVIARDFVFIRSSKTNKITGIVTGTDLSEQFQRLSKAFLLISQIENRLRSMIRGKFELETLKAACNETDAQRREKIESAADLTFGEYIRLLEVEDNWQKLGLVIDRKIFCAQMAEIRDIRNDVAHFDPDGPDEHEVEKLRKFSEFLETLETLSLRERIWGRNQSGQ
jgi:predicted transcriptional regulator